MRIFCKILLIFVLLGVVHGHTYLSSVYVDGVLLREDDNCVRPHPNKDAGAPQAREDPIILLSDADNTCGYPKLQIQPRGSVL